MVYSSPHLSLAVLEALVHVEVSDLPDTLVVCEIQFPDGELGTLDTAALDPKWDPDALFETASIFPSLPRTRAFGDDWVAGMRVLALAVPSAIIPIERNVLLNPGHPRAASLQIIRKAPFRFDTRLRS